VRLLVVVPFVLACSDRDRPEVQPDPQRTHRVIESGAPVHSLPPHQIRADGVGPYKLGERLDVLLAALPSGPRMATFDIRGVVHSNILHAEDNDTVVIGGEPGGAASFVAVTDRKVASTSGIHVGSTRDELTRALGAPLEDVQRARDPRLVVPSGLRNVRMILDGDAIAAIVVTGESAPTVSQNPGECPRPASTGDRIGTCLGTGELASIEGDEITLRAPEVEKPIVSWTVKNLVFARPLRADGHDELIAITRVIDENTKTWWLFQFGLDNKNKLVKADATKLYELSTTNARWIGADLPEVDLYLELQSRSDAIEVGGLLTTRRGDRIRDVVVISPVLIPRRHGKSVTPEAPDAGVTGALPEPGSAGRSKP
jgi:hypothetical protein